MSTKIALVTGGSSGIGQATGVKLRVVSGTGPYAMQARAMAESMTSETYRRRESPATLIADTIARAVTAQRPKTRYAVGYGAKPLIFLQGLV